ENPYGIELWEGDKIAPYEEQDSRDYLIIDNLIEGNVLGISSIVTEHLVARNNIFSRNKEDIYLADKPVNDTITGNIFKSPTLYHIRSTSTELVNAVNNTYIPMIDSLIHNRIVGNVNWMPYNRTDEPRVQEAPPCDMAERPGVWTIYADPGYGKRADETLEWDYSNAKVGAASVKMYTPRGWDVGLNYRPGEDSLALWNLSENDTLSFYVKTLNLSSYGYQGFTIRIGNTSQGYYQYTGAAALLNNAKNSWKRYRIPLKGNSSFTRTVVGNMSLSNVNYVEFRADTWDYGYTIWLDGVQFKACTPTGIDDTPVTATFGSGCYPNPFSDKTTFWFDLPENGPVKLAIFDLTGRCITSLIDQTMPAGRYEKVFSRGKMHPGIYFYRLQTGKRLVTGKIVTSDE
ncbi:MAG: T9SS type A sorting domain-containing protein, partial [Bacteroidales bacterium]|nr:T9SS type A sorting domain-containing protein [Bacteroidales bacterium]